MAPTSTDTSESISFDITPAPCVEVEEHDGVVRSIDIVWCEYRFSEAYGRRVAELLPLCDGTRDLPEISAALGEPIERVRTLVTALYSRAVLHDTSHCDAPADLCQLHLVASGRTLRARMSAEADLLDGQLHSRRLLGSLVETFHFVSSASYHLGAAVAHAPSRHIRDGLARMFADEWKHGTDLREGLKAAGLSDEEIDGSQPLPETQSVINYLRSLASTDLLAYGVCAAINESPKTDTAIKESWDSLAQSGLLPPEAIAPFRGHELEDEASDHASIAGLLFSEHSMISRAQQLRIRDCLAGFLATQSACYAGMKRYYEAAEGAALWQPRDRM